MYTLLTSALLATPAHAWDRGDARGACPAGIAWTETPRVVLHTDSVSAFFSLKDQLSIYVAMADIHDQYAQVGATWAGISTFERSDEPFTGAWYADGPAIHVGFSTDPGAPGTTVNDVDLSTCTIREARLTLRDPGQVAWAFSDPRGRGEAWYDATAWNAAGQVWFRLVYGHELMHALGFKHDESGGLSLLNDSFKGWVRGGAGDELVLLPDDVAALRAVYPAPGSRVDMRLTNSLHDLDNVTGQGAPMEWLCRPAVGGPSADPFAQYCASVGRRCGMESESIRTRVAVHNLGTDALDLTMELYFSADDILDAGDIPAANTTIGTLAAASTGEFMRQYTIPGGVPTGTYTLLLRVEGIAGGGAAVVQEIPLRGRFQVRTTCP